MRDMAVLINVASVIAGFGMVVLVFRIQREIEMSARGERIWIPWADRLLLGGTVADLVVLTALIALRRHPEWLIGLAAGLCSASCLVGAAYPFAILAHYRLILGRGRTGPRKNPEPSERIITIIASIVAVGVLVFVWRDWQ